MTHRRAERITGMEIRLLDKGRARLYYAAYDGSGIEASKGSGMHSSEALEDLIKNNYDRVGQIVYDQQGWRCLSCNLIKPLQRHHMTPRSKGRDDRRENLCGMCPKCHEAVTNGEQLKIHPRMAAVMKEYGLEFSPSGWVGI